MIVKGFDRVWHAALRSTMRFYNINASIIRVIRNLYDQTSSIVYLNGNSRDWFRTKVGVRQGCLLSTKLFDTFLERMMEDAIEERQGILSIGGRTITNLRFARRWYEMMADWRFQSRS